MTESDETRNTKPERERMRPPARARTPRAARRDRLALVCLAAALVLSVACGIIASHYAARADAAWNREGYAGALADARRELARSEGEGRGVQPAETERAERLAGERMWLPRYVPDSALRYQRTANAFGLVGLFSLLAFVTLAPWYAYRKREAIAPLFRRRPSLFDDSDR